MEMNDFEILLIDVTFYIYYFQKLLIEKTNIIGTSG